MASASATLGAIGVSHRTCLPCSSAASASVRWSDVGTVRSTASTDRSSSTGVGSVKAGTPQRVASASTRLALRPTIAASSTPAMPAQAWAWTDPIAPAPNTATRTGSPPGRRPFGTHALDAVNERGEQLVGLADDVNVRQPPEQLLEHHLDLAPREVRAETEVRTPATEPDVLVRCARDVEPEGIGERALVAVGRGVPQHDLLAGANELAGDLDVPCGRPPEVDHWCRPAHDLLHRGRGDALEVRGPRPAFVREVGECLHPVADRVPRRLVAGDHQEDEERRELRRCQPVAV